MRIFRNANGRKGGARPRGSGSPPPNRRKVSPPKEDRAPTRSAGGPDRRARILKVLLSGFKLLLALAAAGAAIWGGIQGYRHATTSDYFALKIVRIEGNRRMTSAEVMRAGGIEEGMNLFSIDVEDAARRIEAHPWIASAEVARQLPETATIQVVERKARILVLFDVPYLVDDAGEIFKRWAPDDPILTPVLSGITREQLISDEEGVREITRTAISLARRYRAAGLESIAPISEIHQEVDGGFSLTIGEDPFYVRFGKGPFRRKLARLATLLKQVKKDGQRPAMIFFDNEVRPDRVTVKTKPPAEPESIAAAVDGP